MGARSSVASERRHLLPRWPSDSIVFALLVGGLVVAGALGIDLVVGMAPGAVAAVVQKVGGHVRAWRRGGVEKAFVMESSAISFYVVVAGIAILSVLDASGVDVPIGWLLLGALFVDTTVRSLRESRYA